MILVNTLPNLKPLAPNLQKLYNRKVSISSYLKLFERHRKYRKIREAFEIRRHGCGLGKGLNEDMGSYIRTDIWDPVLASI